MALSKFRNKEEAAVAVVKLVEEVARRAEELRQRVKWGGELEEALKALKEELERRS